MGTPSPHVAGRLRMLTGRVVSADEAGALVATASGRLRATWGAGLLVASAGRPGALARRGDAVRLTAWPDGRTTLEAVLMRPVARPASRAGSPAHAADPAPAGSAEPGSAADGSAVDGSAVDGSAEAVSG